jgi:hypothetical protein
MQRRSTTVRLRAAVLASLAAQACYSYAPVDSQSPAPAGQYVALRISDRGRVGLNDRFGEGVREIAGRVVQQEGNDLVLSVDHISNLEGAVTRWAGDTTRVNRDYVGYMTARRFSAAKTSLIAVAAAAGIYVMSVNGLIGGGRDIEKSDDPNEGKAKNLLPGRPRVSHDIRVPLWRIWIR